MKRGGDVEVGPALPPKRLAGVPWALRFLFAPKDVEQIQGAREFMHMQTHSGCKFLTPQEPCSAYPELREVGISGPTLEAVGNATKWVLNQAGVSVASRVRVLLPSEAGQALDVVKGGMAGKEMQALQLQTGFVSFLEPAVDAAEQVISLQGPIEGVMAGLGLVAKTVRTLNGGDNMPSIPWSAPPPAVLVPPPGVPSGVPPVPLPAPQVLLPPNLGKGGVGIDGFLGKEGLEAFGKVGFAKGGKDDWTGSAPLLPPPPPAMPQAPGILPPPVPMTMPLPTPPMGLPILPTVSLKPNPIFLGLGDAPFYALKILVAAEEAKVLRSVEGVTLINEIQEKARVEVLTSGEQQFYPGTSLQEFIVKGVRVEMVVGAAVQLLTAILETLGQLVNGEKSQQPGFVKVRTALCSKAAMALIGPGGQVIKQVRSQSQMHVHVETTIVPPGAMGDLSEQVVTLDGPGAGVQTAFNLISEVSSQFMREDFFKAWANNSHCGLTFPGLILFNEGKGKSGKAKSKGGSYGGMALKLLVAPHEATGTKLTLSTREFRYPGTGLQELRIFGSSKEAVINAAMQAVSKIVEESGGSLSGGEPGVESGQSRLKFAIPARASENVIGPSGMHLNSVSDASGMLVEYEEQLIPPGPLTDTQEQVIGLAGPVQGIPLALHAVCGKLAPYANESWFESWASHTNCSTEQDGRLNLFNGRAKGKAGSFGPKTKQFFMPTKDPQVVAMATATAAADYAAAYAGATPIGGGTELGGADFSGIQQAALLQLAASSLPAPGLASADGVAAQPVAFKLLLSDQEVKTLKADAETMRQLHQTTSTSGLISEECFPGFREADKMQELFVSGPTLQAVFTALSAILGKVGEVLGCISSGEDNVEKGEGRIKAMIPSYCIAPLVGSDGQNVKALKQQTGVSVSVDMTVLPCTEEVGEQAVVLRGPLSGISLALHTVLAEVARHVDESWFKDWSEHSNCGLVIPGFRFFSGGKIHGR
eukprot:TRINITY_DN10301_c0_g3_i5.p1 TRINITY_DN10301_c0_g3~~TRINITY_DN10301_c0_g3_i5.p1  ORF type:complete len:987 (-),score=243.32 TRINITY_DN10301_c0_g3_i5:96-3056(-)